MEPPVPIPNTEVKRPSADDTEGATPCGKYATARRLFFWSLLKVHINQISPLTFTFTCFMLIIIVLSLVVSREAGIGDKWLADLKNFQSGLAGFLP